MIVSFGVSSLNFLDLDISFIHVHLINWKQKLLNLSLHIKSQTSFKHVLLILIDELLIVNSEKNQKHAWKTVTKM